MDIPPRTPPAELSGWYNHSETYTDWMKYYDDVSSDADRAYTDQKVDELTGPYAQRLATAETKLTQLSQVERGLERLSMFEEFANSSVIDDSIARMDELQTQSTHLKTRQQTLESQITANLANTNERMAALEAQRVDVEQKQTLLKGRLDQQMKEADNALSNLETKRVKLTTDQSQLNSRFDADVQRTKLQLDAKLKTLNETNSNFRAELDDLDERKLVLSERMDGMNSKFQEFETNTTLQLAILQDDIGVNQNSFLAKMREITQLQHDADTLISGRQDRLNQLEASIQAISNGDETILNAENAVQRVNRLTDLETAMQTKVNASDLVALARPYYDAFKALSHPLLHKCELKCEDNYIDQLVSVTPHGTLGQTVPNPNGQICVLKCKDQQQWGVRNDDLVDSFQHGQEEFFSKLERSCSTSNTPPDPPEIMESRKAICRINGFLPS